MPNSDRFRPRLFSRQLRSRLCSRPQWTKKKVRRMRMSRSLRRPTRLFTSSWLVRTICLVVHRENKRTSQHEYMKHAFLLCSFYTSLYYWFYGCSSFVVILRPASQLLTLQGSVAVIGVAGTAVFFVKKNKKPSRSVPLDYNHSL